MDNEYIVLCKLIEQTTDKLHELLKDELSPDKRETLINYAIEHINMCNKNKYETPMCCVWKILKNHKCIPFGRFLV